MKRKSGLSGTSFGNGSQTLTSASNLTVYDAPPATLDARGVARTLLRHSDPVVSRAAQQIVDYLTTAIQAMARDDLAKLVIASAEIPAVTKTARVLVLDVETLRPVRPTAPPGEPPPVLVPGIEYVASFQDWLSLGIAYVGLHDSGIDGPPFGYEGEALGGTSGLPELIECADVIVTFNGIKFDAPLLAAHGVTIPAAKHYDILREAWIAHGLDPDRYVKATHSGQGLTDYARVNLGTEKTGDGQNAAILWQQGRQQEVVDYCHNDVALTRDLFAIIQETGGLISPKTGQRVAMRRVA